MLLLLSLLISLIFFLSHYILPLTGIPEQVATKASSFLVITSPGLAFKVQAILARNHMKAQRVMWPTLVTQLIVLGFHVGAL